MPKLICFILRIHKKQRNSNKHKMYNFQFSLELLNQVSRIFFLFYCVFKQDLLIQIYLITCLNSYYLNILILQLIFIITDMLLLIKYDIYC